MRNKEYMLGVPVSRHEALKSLEEALSLLGVKPLEEILPSPGEDPEAWTPAERRTMVLLRAWVQGEFPRLVGRREAQIGVRIAELAEGLEVGPWLGEIPKVEALAYEEENGVANPLEAARAILEGRRTPIAPSLSRLEVAKRLHYLVRLKEIEERVDRLLTRHPRAKVEPKDLRVILGRLRSGKPVWVRASEEEFHRLKEEVVKALARTQEAPYLDPAWRFGKDEDLPHPRLLVALERVKREELERALEALREAEWADPRPKPWPHRAFLEGEEVEVLEALGVEGDWTDPRDTLRALEEALGKAQALPKAVRANLSPRALDRLGVDRPTRGAILRFLKGLKGKVLREIEGKTRTPENQGLREFLARFRPRPQAWVKEAMREVRRALERGEKPDPETVQALALEAAVGALEVFLFRLGFEEEALSLAWEFGERAVKEMRSPHYHPAAYAARKARDSVLSFLLGRKGGSLGEAELRLVARARRALRKGVSKEDLPHHLGVGEEALRGLMDLVEGPLTPLDAEADPPSGEDPLERAARREAQALLEEALKDLERRVPEAVEIAEWLMGGKTLAEAAKEMGLPLEEAEVIWGVAQMVLRRDPRVKRAQEVLRE